MRNEKITYLNGIVHLCINYTVDDLDIDLGLDDPVCLRFEGLDLVMAFHTEPQCRCLARAERDQRGVQIPVFSLKILGLEPEQRMRVD